MDYGAELQHKWSLSMQNYFCNLKQYKKKPVIIYQPQIFGWLATCSNFPKNQLSFFRYFKKRKVADFFPHQNYSSCHTIFWKSHYSYSSEECQHHFPHHPLTFWLSLCALTSSLLYPQVYWNRKGVKLLCTKTLINLRFIF